MDSLWSQHGETEASRVNGNPAPEESSQNMSLEHRIS
uniref:Uncharacterized protein n=1 Tax=Rhizophora mucronata TaxID=61149 RepID=A0A2P2QRM1_RHIMU